MTIPTKYRFEKSERTSKDMNKVTVSGYNKNEVLNKLLERIRFHDVEKANYWTAELVSSGHTLWLLHRLIAYASQEIHIQNLKLPSRLLNRVYLCKLYLSNDVFVDRNKQQIRNLMCDITTTITLSSKKPMKMPKIGEVDFEVNYISSRIISKNASLADQILTSDDPRDLVIPVNELATNILMLRAQLTNKTKLLTRDVGSLDPYYWLSWLLEWDKQMTSRKLKDVDYKCASRKNAAYDDKLSTDVVWVVWDCILRINETLGDSLISNQVEALYHLYTIDYARGKRIERKFMMNHAVQLLTNNIETISEVTVDHRKNLRAQSLVNLSYEAIIKEADDWDAKLRQEKVAHFVERSEPDKHPEVEIKINKQDDDAEKIGQDINYFMKSSEFDDITDEIQCGGLISNIQTQHHDKIADTESAFQMRQKEYEPVRYDRSHEAPPPPQNTVITFPREEPSTQHIQQVRREEPVRVTNLQRRQSRGSSKSTLPIRKMPQDKSTDSGQSARHTNEKFSKCPDGSISLPLNCTKGVGCLYMSPSEIADKQVSNSCSRPSTDLDADYMDIVIIPDDDKHKPASRSDKKHM